MAEIDYRSMTMALDALQSLDAAGHAGLTMSINVSAAILADADYPGVLHWALQTRGLSPGRICVEVLETTILDGSRADIMGAVARLKRLGVRVALDDFGTGYAGLAHMASFEVDAIKLDRSMIARLEQDPRNRVIVRAIIRLCRLLHMSVVAEGVETEAQRAMLHRANCPVIQGYGLARPMPLSALIDWLRTRADRPAAPRPARAARHACPRAAMRADHCPRPPRPLSPCHHGFSRTERGSWQPINTSITCRMCPRPIRAARNASRTST